jgi:hypothetical protein
MLRAAGAVSSLTNHWEEMEEQLEEIEIGMRQDRAVEITSYHAALVAIAAAVDPMASFLLKKRS